MVSYAKIVLLCAFICLIVGCVHEDTTPSSALFPTTGQYVSTSIGGVAPSENDRRDFSRLLQSNAPRKKVELISLFGSSYSSNPNRNAAWEEVENGFYQGEDGKQVYRVHSLHQAEQVLKHNWTQENWSTSSDLAKVFQKLPNASVVKLSSTDQRILFFNESNRLVGCYPAAK